MKEIWKDIKGYENRYQISNLGNVKSKERYEKNNINGGKRLIKEHILKPNIRNGYYVVQIKKNGKRHTFQVSRLVAEAFIPNPKNKSQVNHIDYNRLNNKVINLEWTTVLENILWSREHYKHWRNTGSKEHKYIRFKDNKYELSLKNKYIGRYNTLDEARIVRNELIKGDKYYEGFDITK